MAGIDEFQGLEVPHPHPIYIPYKNHHKNHRFDRIELKLGKKLAKVVPFSVLKDGTLAIHSYFFRIFFIIF